MVYSENFVEALSDLDTLVQLESPSFAHSRVEGDTSPSFDTCNKKSVSVSSDDSQSILDAQSFIVTINCTLPDAKDHYLTRTLT